MDVTKAKSIKTAFDSAEEKFGAVEILSNNAGVADAKMAVHIDEKSWDFVLDTNLKGAWLVAQEAGLRMIATEKTRKYNQYSLYSWIARGYFASQLCHIKGRCCATYQSFSA